ncbi:hypothetical protein SAMN05216436_12110 [bacterium A37T11]|nr:hypothetical protein SAMN05216436_12110 [bacterium A37T11]
MSVITLVILRSAHSDRKGKKWRLTEKNADSRHPIAICGEKRIIKY